MIQTGDKAPDFTLSDANERTVSLSKFLGKKVIVYFYPKDNTPGCTKEACSFRDAYDEFLAKGAVVIGISPDSARDHKDFRQRNNLPFHLLADEDHKVAESYGVWGEKMMFGKQTIGIHRTTFIVDEKGIVAKVFADVKPEKHAKEVLAAL